MLWIVDASDCRQAWYYIKGEWSLLFKLLFCKLVGSWICWVNHSFSVPTNYWNKIAFSQLGHDELTQKKKKLGKIDERISYSVIQEMSDIIMFYLKRFRIYFQKIDHEKAFVYLDHGKAFVYLFVFLLPSSCPVGDKLWRDDFYFFFYCAQIFMWKRDMATIFRHISINLLQRRHSIQEKK